MKTLQESLLDPDFIPEDPEDIKNMKLAIEIIEFTLKRISKYSQVVEDNPTGGTKWGLRNVEPPKVRYMGAEENRKYYHVYTSRPVYTIARTFMDHLSEVVKDDVHAKGNYDPNGLYMWISKDVVFSGPEFAVQHHKGQYNDACKIVFWYPKAKQEICIGWSTYGHKLDDNGYFRAYELTGKLYKASRCYPWRSERMYWAKNPVIAKRIWNMLLKSLKGIKPSDNDHEQWDYSSGEYK